MACLKPPPHARVRRCALAQGLGYPQRIAAELESHQRGAGGGTGTGGSLRNHGSSPGELYQPSRPRRAATHPNLPEFLAQARGHRR